MCAFFKVWICVYLGFVMCVCMFVFIKVWICVCMCFLMCGCGYVRVF